MLRWLPRPGPASSAYDRWLSGIAGSLLDYLSQKAKVAPSQALREAFRETEEDDAEMSSAFLTNDRLAGLMIGHITMPPSVVVVGCLPALSETASLARYHRSIRHELLP